MKSFINSVGGPLTVVLIVLTILVGLVGGGVVIWGTPGALPFDTYIHDLEGFAAAIGLLGVGKGIANHTNSADPNKPQTKI